MKAKYIAIGVLAIGAGLFVFNQFKINALENKLKSYNSNPPQRGSVDWLGWIQLALNWLNTKFGSKIEDLWKPGGPFFNNNRAPRESDVSDYIKQLADQDNP